MMRAISIFVILFYVANAVYSPSVSAYSSSIYDGSFDYKKAHPASDDFPGKSRKQIALECENEELPGMTLASCGHFHYEEAMDLLNKKIRSIEIFVEKNDRELLESGNGPPALPFFKSSQENWLLYRENYCYGEVYQMGPASLRFIDFWHCMTKMTENRLQELNSSDY